MGNNIEIILRFYFSQYKCDIAVIKKKSKDNQRSKCHREPDCG